MRCVLSVSVWLCGGLELDVTDNSGTDSGGRAGDRYWGYIYTLYSCMNMLLYVAPSSFSDFLWTSCLLLGGKRSFSKVLGRKLICTGVVHSSTAV